MPEVLEVDVASRTTDITLPTNIETFVIASPKVVVPVSTARVFVRALVAIAPGTNTTFYNVRLKRGGDGTGQVIGRELGQAVLSAAGSTAHADIAVVDAVANVSEVQYSVTVEQAGATGNGVVRQASIEVMVLNG